MSEMLAGKIGFYIGFKLDTNELSSWTPERITAFFDGVTKALEAKVSLTETQSLPSRLQKAERERDIYKRAVEQYAKKSLWVYSERPFSAFRTLYYPPDKQEHGYDIAQAAIREAEGNET